MKTAVKIGVCALLCAAVATLAACVKARAENQFYSVTGVKLPKCETVKTTDTTGWFGDGEVTYTFTFNQANGKALEDALKSAKSWAALPMPADLEEQTYVYYHASVPRVESGYYYYGGGEYTFSVAIYDAQARTVYFSGINI